MTTQLPTVSSRTIPATGVGHADYSTNIQSSVETLVSGSQTDFHFAQFIPGLGVGATTTITIPITSGYVAMMYDFEVSADANDFVSFKGTMVSNGVSTLIFAKSGYQKATVLISRGFPFFNQISVAITNQGSAPYDVDFHCHGIQLAQSIYTLTIPTSP